MKIIQDIRLFKSGPQGEQGTYTTSFGEKKLTAMVKRVVMKLREHEFSLGEFDHLYLNFTTSDIADRMTLSEEADRYHPWYRYCTVPVEVSFYNILGKPESYDGIIHWISTVLAAYFATEDFDEARIRSCVQQAVEQGETMRMKFKEKITTKRRAVVFLRFLDTCKFYPLLQVYDPDGHILLEKDLPETVSLDNLGELQVSTKRVTIKPRKNAYTANASPMVFDY